MNLRARREETFMIVYGREVFRRCRRPSAFPFSSFAGIYAFARVARAATAVSPW
jgi:hypothetical protein